MRAADVDITTSTNNGVVLDVFSGTTAQVESGVTVNNTTFNFNCAGSVAAVCATTHAWTLTNLGTIGPPSFGTGVIFEAGGTVINSGSLSGGNAIFIEGGTGGTVNNMLSGTISGNIVIGEISGVAGTVTNAGMMKNDDGGQAVSLWGGGTVTNLATGVIVAHDEANAVAVVGGTSRIIDNYGIIQSNDTGYGTGVSLQSGTLTNYAGAQILGAYNAIWTYTAASTITNYGYLEASKAQGGGSAIEFDAGGTLVNAGTIKSFTSNSTTSDAGVSFSGAGSITNRGTIESTDGGLAISFNGSATHTLNLDTGSVLGGNVKGGTGTDNLVLMGTGTESIAKFLSFETLSMQGTNWTLTNTGTFTTSATVQSGLLSVNGQLTSPAVTVASGATLGGTGTIVGNVTNNGNVAPGNSIGTLNVTGNYTQATGSTLTPEVNTTSSDLLHVTGTATIQAGASVSVQVAPGFYTLGHRYTILTALAGVSGTYATLTDDAPFVDFQLNYDATNVYLDVIMSGLPFAQVAQTPNEKAAASGLQSLGAGNPIFNAAIMLNTPDALRAFDLLSGEIHASVIGTFLDESRFIRDAILGRARQSMGGPASLLAPQIAAWNFGGTEALAYAGTGEKRAAGIERAPMAKAAAGPSYAIWAQPFGDWGRSAGDGNAAALARKTGGVIGGLDATIPGSWEDAWRFGLGGGYQRTFANIDDRSSSATIDTYHLAAYGGVQHGPIGLRVGAAYSWHDITTSRSIVFPGFGDTTNASYDANTAQVFGEFGYGFAWRQIALEPFADLAYVNVRRNDFAETGGPASLVGTAVDSDTTFSTLGLRGAVPLFGGIGLVARGSLGWRHAFGTVTPTAQLAFASGSVPFVVAGVPIAKDAASLELGLDGPVAHNATLGVAYSGQLSEHAQDHGIKASFVQRF